MPAFLPPTSTQLTDITSVLTLIQAASDKDVQATIALMKKQADAAEASRAAAADLVNEANTKVKRAEDLGEALAEQRADLERKQAQVGIDGATIDKRFSEVADAERSLAAATAATTKALAERESRVASRENNIDEREAEAQALSVKANTIIQEYEAKVAKLQQTISG